jgi:nicotinamide phosphoribosyltransferase
MSNLILMTDSYKFSHWLQYPPKTTAMYSYLESRGGRYSRTVFFGLQMLMKKYLETPVTMENVNEAEAFAKGHGVPFNREGWERVVNVHGGRLPIRIHAVPEGMVIPTNNILMSCESLDPECFWVVSWLETMLMRVWYPITVATQSWHIRGLIQEYLGRTSENPEAELPFKLHDFGARGVSSGESAEFGGAAHLVNFMGSDTVEGVVAANRYYKHPMAGYSIPAMEHSSVTSWGREGEANAYRNMLKHFAKPGAIVACVSDSFDIYHTVEKIWGEQLKQEVLNSGATIVVRPDSGNPTAVVLKCLTLLEGKFGSSRTKNGYRVLNNVRVIQGDGINEDSIREILETITRAGFSASNVAFGMGGALLQQVNRDTQKFAYKCSEITCQGQKIPVFKDPVTDPGKRSKSGRLDLTVSLGKYQTITGDNHPGSVMRVVYENGKVVKEYTLEEIRKNALTELE